jgi:hypothetical protein
MAKKRTKTKVRASKATSDVETKLEQRKKKRFPKKFRR